MKHVYTYIQSHLNIIVFKTEAESLVKLSDTLFCFLHMIVL